MRSPGRAWVWILVVLAVLGIVAVGIRFLVENPDSPYANPRDFFKLFRGELKSNPKPSPKRSRT